MPKAYYSMTFDNTAAEVWSRINDFNEDTWSGDVSKSWSENDKTGQEVGNIRIIQIGDKQLRQSLRAYSEVERSYSYDFVGLPSMPVRNFLATIRVTPVINDNRAFVEWFATFDCDEVNDDYCSTYFLEGCKRWLTALCKELG